VPTDGLTDPLSEDGDEVSSEGEAGPPATSTRLSDVPQDQIHDVADIAAVRVGALHQFLVSREVDFHHINNRAELEALARDILVNEFATLALDGDKSEGSDGDV